MQKGSKFQIYYILWYNWYWCTKYSLYQVNNHQLLHYLLDNLMIVMEEIINSILYAPDITDIHKNWWMFFIGQFKVFASKYFTLYVISNYKERYFSASSKACSRPLIDHSTFEWKNYGRTGVLHCINGGYFLHSSRNQIKANSITVHQFNIKCVNGKWTSSDGYGSLPHCFSDMGMFL